KLSGFKFRRQYPIGGFIVDFYCVKERLAIELDGEQHADEQNAQYDEKRSARLNQWGVRVMRFWDYDVLKETEAVVETIWRMLTAGGGTSPQAAPGGPGGGGRGDLGRGARDEKA